MSSQYAYGDVDSYVGVGTGMGPLADSHAASIGDGGLDGPDSYGSSLDRVGGLHSGGGGPGGGRRGSRLLSGLVSHAEHMLTVSLRLKNTTTCIVLYLVLIVLNIFLMSWELAGPRGFHPVILSLELLLTLFIACEVALGVWALGLRAYLSSWPNRIDGGLATLCVLFLVLQLSVPPSAFMSELDALLLAARFLFQAARLSVLIYRSRQAALMQSQEDVDFNSISMEAACGHDDDGMHLDEHDVHHLHHMHDEEHHLGGGEGSGIDGVGHALGLDAPDSPPRHHLQHARQGSVGGMLPTTSHIFLKPSVRLELQNALAFAGAPSTGSGSSASSSASSSSSESSSSSSSSSGSSHNSSSSSNDADEAIDLTSAGNAASSRSDAGPLSNVSSPTSAASTPGILSGARTRTLHPLLAHDSAGLYEEDLDNL